MKPAIEWLNELAETVATSMFSGRNPPGAEVQELIERIQTDAKSEQSEGCPESIPQECEYRLKPCPFCGGSATLRRTPQNGVFVDCDLCCASSKLVYGDKTDARPLVIEAWNTRIAPNDK